MENPNYVDIILAIIAVASLILSYKSVQQSSRSLAVSEAANSQSANIARRQGVVELHTAWKDVAEIETHDATRMIGPDIIKAHNAIDLTAALWNHDVIQKEILFQQYWESYREIYDKLYSSNLIVPGKAKTCRSMIRKELTKTYEEMKAMELSGVVQTRI